MSSKLHQSSVLAAVLASVTMMAMPAFAASTVSVSGPATVVPGDLLQLDIMAADFLDLYAYQFDISFDPAAFAITNVSEGSFLSGFGSTFFDGGQSNNVAGTVTFILNTLIGPGSGANGSGSWAQLSFLALPSFSGSAGFAISNVIAVDSALNTIDVSVQGATVTAVPEPSGLLLLLAGLGVVGAAWARARGPDVAAHRQPARV